MPQSKKKSNKNVKKVKKANSAHSAKARNFLFIALGVIIAAIIFLPTTVLLIIAMLPTVVAYVVDRARSKLLAFVVGFMNLAGAVPFILKLWSNGHSMNQMSEIISEPLTIVVIYACAGAGYLIDWIVTDMAAVFIVKKAKARMKAIVKQQKSLVERWGPEVNASYVAGDEDMVDE